MRGENGSTRGKASQSKVETISLLHIWHQMRKLVDHERQELSQYVVLVFFFFKYCYRLRIVMLCYLFN